jgi:hypothetical protein
LLGNIDQFTQAGGTTGFGGKPKITREPGDLDTAKR